MKLLEWLISLFPDDFRRAHEDEVLDFARQEHAALVDGLLPRIRFWLRTWANVSASVFRVRYAEGRHRRTAPTSERFHALLSDGRRGIRSICRTPLVSLVIVTTLAFGIGTSQVRDVLATQTLALDKLKVLEKETAFFEFPFNVSNGQMNVDFQWAIVRPGIDQLRGSVKNSLCINRWVDVSNEKSGITWVTLEAPYIEIGPMKDSWDNDDVGPTQRINSLVMTNRWHVNYRAYQQGYAKFRYSIIPHRSYNSVFSTKAAIERSQPLISAPAVISTKRASLLKLSNDNVIATAFKLSNSGDSYVLRLWNPGDNSEMCNIDWKNKKPKIWTSDFSEEKGTELQLPFELLPKEIITMLIKI